MKDWGGSLLIIVEYEFKRAGKYLKMFWGFFVFCFFKCST